MHYDLQYITVFIGERDRSGETNLCIACPAGKGLWGGVCKTGRWWDECRCEWQRCVGPSPSPAPFSPSRLVDRSMTVSAFQAPDEGAAAETPNQQTHAFFVCDHIKKYEFNCWWFDQECLVLWSSSWSCCYSTSFHINRIIIFLHGILLYWTGQKQWFQTFMTFFRLLNTKVIILKKAKNL